MASPPSASTTSPSTTIPSTAIPSILLRLIILLPALYVLLIALLLLSPRLQAFLTYLHYVRPPSAPTLRPHRLASHARHITKAHLHGWHLVPPGPPFAHSTTHYDTRLRQPSQRIVLFFHGTSGTRAFPSARVTLIKQLCAHLHAHVVTFDYSGYAESAGTPSETALVSDARLAHAWLMERVHPSSELLLYGASLGAYPALALAARLSRSSFPPTAVITDSAPASLLEAGMTHPVGLPFRVFPGARALWAAFLKERLDNVASVADVRVPLLILHGEDDWMISVAQARLLYHAASNAGNDVVRLVTFAGAGHNDVAAAPSFLTVLWSFVQRHSRIDPLLQRSPDRFCNRSSLSSSSSSSSPSSSPAFCYPNDHA